MDISKKKSNRRRMFFAYDAEIIVSSLPSKTPMSVCLLAPSGSERRILSEPITQELLDNLRIPGEYHARLLTIQTEDDHHKKAIWSVYQAYLQQLKKSSVESWEQARIRAEALVTCDSEYQSFDAVIVDEAHDLDPALLPLLLGLCKTPSRFFITADANQSIYGSGFNWSDVHESLKFQGRTSILRANYRSTREIGEAAQSYLSTGVLEDEPVEYKYTHNGPLPVMREVRNDSEEVQLLVRFFRGAMREMRFSLGSCALLCPSNERGKHLAAHLKNDRAKSGWPNAP